MKRKKHTYDFNHYRETFVFFFFGSYIRSIISSDKKGEVKGSISIILNFNEALH